MCVCASVWGVFLWGPRREDHPPEPRDQIPEDAQGLLLLPLLAPIVQNQHNVALEDVFEKINHSSSKRGLPTASSFAASVCQQCMVSFNASNKKITRPSSPQPPLRRRRDPCKRHATRTASASPLLKRPATASLR